MSPVRIVVLLCLAEVLSMTMFAAFPALIPVLLPEWRLANAEAGLIGGMFYGGYLLAAPVLTPLTDRMDARRIYVLACALAGLGGFGFAFIAADTASALVFQALIGAGLAGTYMPGLKLLSDLVEESPRRGRYVAFYTSTFGIGASVSYVIVGTIEPAFGWRAVFFVSGFGPLAAAALVRLALPPSRVAPSPQARPHLLDFRPVFRNRVARGYILGYSAHCYEMFGIGAWIVAFLAFSATLQPDGNAMPWDPRWTVAVVGTLAIPASILGNELATRHGRRPVILAIMSLSGLAACVLGLLAPLPWHVLAAAYAVYLVLGMGDSSALTNGVIGAAEPHLRGATMAIYSFLGIGTGLIAPFLFGVVLDLAGGNTSRLAWGLGFAIMGAAGALAPLALLVSRFPGKDTKPLDPAGP